MEGISKSLGLQDPQTIELRAPGDHLLSLPARSRAFIHSVPVPVKCGKTGIPDQSPCPQEFILEGWETYTYSTS